MSQLPTTNTDPMQTFRDRVLEKLRGDIGEMLPDEALATLVQQAVNDQFFKERKVPSSRTYGPDETKPSWFVEEVARIGTPIIREHIAAWVSDNRETIDAAVKEFLSSQNLMLLMMAAMQQHTSQAIWSSAEAFYRRTKQPY